MVLIISCRLSSLYFMYVYIFFFKQKTAYEMRISDWSSDVCSSDLMSDSSQPRAGGRHAATVIISPASTRWLVVTELYRLRHAIPSRALPGHGCVPTYRLA